MFEDLFNSIDEKQILEVLKTRLTSEAFTWAKTHLNTVIERAKQINLLAVMPKVSYLLNDENKKFDLKEVKRILTDEVGLDISDLK